MTTATLMVRSLRHYLAAHTATGLATAACAAVITGALLVGDSVRGSLRQRVTQRLGRTTHAVVAGDRLLTAGLAQRLGVRLGVPSVPLLQVSGVASAPDSGTRLARAQVLGVDDGFAAMAAGVTFPLPAAGQVVMGHAAAARLGVAPGATLVIRVEKITAFARDTPLAAASERQAALRLTLLTVLGDEQLADFSLNADNQTPANLFVNRGELCRVLGLDDRANLVLLCVPETAHPRSVAAALEAEWDLADVGLEVRPATAGGAELTSSRIFLDPGLSRTAAAQAQGSATFLTYFANELRHGDRATPYSFVTGTDAAWLPAGLGDDGIAVSRWLADDLGCAVGDTLEAHYVAIGPLQSLEERTVALTVRHIVPQAEPFADPTLMPAIPGLGDAERCADWEPGLPIDLARVRARDEAYWKQWRGTPKAFVTLATARRLWANRFGDATAVRLPLPPAAAARYLRQELRLEDMGVSARPILAEGLRAAGQAISFAQLFLGLSGFLIGAALLLTALLFGLSLDRRREQFGTLLALGFTPQQVRHLLLWEGLCVALPGAVAGVAMGLLYNRLVVAGLGRIWRDSLGGMPVQPYASAGSLVLGAVASAACAALVLWGTLRRLGRSSVDALQRGSPGLPAGARHVRRWALAGFLCAGVGIAVALQGDPGRGQAAAGVFFAAGAILLGAGLLWVTAGIHALRGVRSGALTVRNAARRPGRSVTVSAALACSVFLVVAVGANRRQAPAHATARAAGTGGFAFYGETTVPILADINTIEGQRSLHLDPPPVPGLRVVNLAATNGEDASCLNLNRASRPQVLGVDPGEFADRGAFRFARLVPTVDPANPWRSLDADLGPDVIPAIVDDSVLVWSLGLRLGDALALTDGRGRRVQFRFVATLAGSVLQGRVLIAADRFRDLFPDAGGARVLLVDAGAGQEALAARWLEDGLADYGLELTPCSARLAAFNAVENTYLAIFLALGGLGLVLGCLGLGAVVLRHVLERRGELALLRAVGFGRVEVVRQVSLEHLALLGAGLLVGLVSGLVAVAPALQAARGNAALDEVAWWTAAIAASGAAWILAAALAATRGAPLAGLRDE